MDPLEAVTSILASFQKLLRALAAPSDWQTRRGISSAKADLRYHQDNFKDTIENLLGLLVDGEAELAELCGNPQNKKWKDPNLDTAIRRKFERSYERIQYTLEEMSALLGDIQDDLKEVEIPLNRDNCLPENLVSLPIFEVRSRNAI